MPTLTPGGYVDVSAPSTPAVVDVTAPGRFVDVHTAPRVTVGGPAGGTRYLHTQTAPAAQWTVTHNLGTFPQVVTIGDSEPGRPVIADVFYVDANTLTITWPSPESGKAYLS
ncbi:hypothetical protein [Phycicoccus avicenniae]|uniref:hypothetical protein n=1 Tax=Phycicoccus avicenniae TaxID=2828860 RepID=UPI003D2D9498